MDPRGHARVVRGLRPRVPAGRPCLALPRLTRRRRRWYYLFLRILWKSVVGRDVHSAGKEYEGTSDEDPKED